MCNFNIHKWENAYIKDLNVWRILKNFMYIFRRRKGGCTNACICMGTHSQPFRTAWRKFTKFEGDEVFIDPHMCCCLSPKGGSRAGQNRSKGAPFSKNFFRQKSYSNNWMHSMLLLLIPLRSLIFEAVLLHLFDLVIFAYLMQFL